MKRGVLIIAGVIFLIVITVLVIVLKNTSKTPVQSATILKIWSPFDEGDTYQAMAKDFLAANPNVKLEFKYIPAKDAKDYEAQVVNGIASGNGPDIWLLRSDWLPKHQTKLVPSVGYINWSGNPKVSDSDAVKQYFGVLANANMLNNKLYTVPFAVDSLALYINTDVISAAERQYRDAGQDDKADVLRSYPKTWADLVTWTHLLTASDSNGFQRSAIDFGTVDNGYAPVDVYTALLSQYGGSLFAADKSVAIHLSNSQDSTQFPGQQSLAFYSSFSNPNNPNYTWSKTAGDPIDAFVKGKLAMMVGYSSLSKEFIVRNKNFSSVSIIPLPQVNDPDITGKRVDFAAYWTHGVSKSSSQPGLAWRFLLAMLDKNLLTDYGKATGKPVISQMSPDASLSTSGASLGETELFALQVLHAPPIYKPEWQQVDETLQDMLNQSTNLGQSVQSAVDSAAERMKAISIP